MTSKDLIETLIGRFGSYQIWIFILVSVARFPAEFLMTNVVFLLPDVNFICLDEGAGNATNFCPCQNPEYDRSKIHSSVTTEWNLICEKMYIASIAQSITHVGILVGSFVYGYISDRYGRRLSTLLALVSETLLMSVSAIVPDIATFIVLRFLGGIALGGVLLCTYVLIIELSGTSFRSIVIGLHELPFVLAYMILPIIAYFVRDWRNLLLVTNAPWLIVFVLYWILPESPLWLISVGRRKEAIDVLTKIAIINKRPTESIETIVDNTLKQANQDEEKYGSYIDLFASPKIRMYTVINAIMWMLCSHTFYGINQYIGRLEGDIYLNVIVSASSLLPGVGFVIAAAYYLKRKTSVLLTSLIAGISLLITILVPNSMKSVILFFATVGQFGAFYTIVINYLYSSEIFPTIVRNSALGFASTCARIGGFIAPFIVNIQIEWLSILIFSILSFCAAAMCYFLPETKDTVLKNTIEEIESKIENKLGQN